MPGKVYKMADVAKIVEDVNARYNAGEPSKDAFIKYATEHNLPPELLRSAVHKWNTYRALNFYHKSANRGDSFHVLDGDEVKNDYIQNAYKPHAEPKNEAMQDCSMEEIPMRKAASEYKPFHEAYTYTPPADTLNLYPKYASKDEGTLLFEKWAQAEKDYGEITGALITSSEAIKEAAADLLKHFQADPKSFTQTEAALKYQEGEKFAYVFDDLAAAAQELGVTFKRASKAERRLIMDDTLIDKLAAYHQHNEALVCLYQGLHSLEESGVLKFAAAVEVPEAEAKAEAEGKPIGTSLGSVPSPQGRPLLHHALNSAPAVSWDDKADLPKPPSDIPLPPVLAKDVLTSLLSHSGVGEQGAKRLTELDRTLQAGKRRIILDRLRLTDPVIGEHDPDVVAELAESIAKHSPEIAGDQNALRSMLREHLQHDALPLSSVKSLTDVHKANRDAERPSKA